jgi:hypothetical protein
MNDPMEQIGMAVAMNPVPERGGNRRASHNQHVSRYSVESDITSTAGYTLSGAHDRQQQQNLEQLTHELSPGK